VQEVTTGNDELIKYYQIGEAVKVGSAENEFTITNTYVAPTSITLNAKKEITGHALTLEDNAFTFQLKADEEVLREAKNTANGSVTFDAIQYTLADMVGTDGNPVTEKVFKYTISEVKGTNTEHFTYDPTTYTAKVKVTVVTGKDGAESLEAELLGYYTEANGQVNEAVFKNEYKVTPTELVLPVAKMLNNNSKIDKDRTFTFGLYAGYSETPAATLPLTVGKEKSTATGEFTIKFTEAGTYSYTVKEINCNDKDIVYDNTAYTVEVKVVDDQGKLKVSKINGDSKTTAETLNFTNTYVEEIPVVLEAKKNVTGATLEKEQFTFQLVAKYGAPMPNNAVKLTAKNDAEGNVTFDEITYDLSDMVDADGKPVAERVFEYTITEVNDGQGGYTYDKENPVEVTVTITQDAKTKQLSKEVVYKKGNVTSNVFTNDYNAKDTEVTLSVSKKLVNGEANKTERTFTFQLSGAATNDGDSLTGTKTATVTVSANSDDPVSGFFDEIVFSKPGTFKYTIAELKNTAPTYTDVAYDSSIYDVVVEVKDENGELKVTSTKYTLQNAPEGEEVAVISTAAFENTYIEPISVEFEVDKTLTGTDEKGNDVVLTKDQFTFELTGGKLAEGTTLQAKNDADGKAKFTTEAVFTAEDVGKKFIYTISEVVDNQYGYSYDTKAVTATVAISKKEDGKALKAEVTYQKDGSDAVDKESAKFTNHYELTDLNGTKVWDDQGNFFGTRPTAIEVVVKNGSTVVATKEFPVPAGQNEFSWTIKDLPKYDATGNEIEYTVIETKVTGYLDGVVDELQDAEAAEVATNGTFQITNTLDTFNLPVKKVWQDNEDQDQCRPDSITIKLMRGDETINTVIMAAENNGNVVSWDNEYTFMNLPKLDKDGKPIEYTITETINYSDPEKAEHANYQITYQAYPEQAYPDEEVAEQPVVEEGSITATHETKGVYVINTRKTDDTSVSVEKKWLDGNKDTNRGEIRVQLYANDVAQTPIVTLNEENVWKYTWPSLPVNENGVAIKYTVKELTKDESGNAYKWTEHYQAGTATGVGNNFTITNTLLTDITITKNWDDQSNKYNLRPDTLTIQLLQNGNEYKQVTIGTSTAEDVELTDISNDGNSWSYTFTDLPKYDAQNNEYRYTVKEEEASEAYSSEVEDYVINNTLKTVDIPVQKEWDDNSNQDGKRPQKVTLVLLQGDTELARKVIGIAEGVERPDISQDGNTWSYTFKDLPELDSNGEPYTYSVKEEVVYEVGFAYTQPEDGKAVVKNDTHVLRNVYTPKTTEVTATKVWDDDSDVLDKRPDSVTMDLYKTVDGEERKVDSYDLTENNAKVGNSNTWTHTFPNLPVYENGNLITYTVKETVTYTDGYAYTCTYDEDAVKWTNKLETTSITINKAWAGDEKTLSDTRPGQIQVELYQNGTLYNKYEITSATNWSKTIGDLPKYKSVTVVDGELQYTENEYTIKEVPFDGYTSNTAEPVVVLNGGSHTITNTLNTIEIDVTKEWKVGKTGEAAPETIKVYLMQKAGNDEAVQYADATLEKDKDYKHTFTGLPTHNAKGEAYTYSIKEVEVYGYTAGKTTTEEKVKDGKVTGYAITLTNNIDTTKLTVTKRWLCDAGKETKISLQLMRKAEVDTSWTEYRAPVTLEIAPWTYIFTDLPTHNAEGKAYSYTVKEATIEDYESVVGEVTGTAAEGYAVTVTNTELTEVKVTKKWDNVVNKTLPESITVQLKADNVNVGDPVELKADAGSTTNEWESYTWTNLPKYNSDGKKVNYTVAETKITFADSAIEENYTPAYNDKVDNDETIEYEVEITNTFTPGETSLTVNKAWAGDEGLTNLRPESITVKLMVQLAGETTARDTYKTAELEAPWTYTFSNLPIEREGKAATYFVEEVLDADTKAKGYKLTNTAWDESGMSVTLTNTLEVVNIEVVKDWQDDNNRDNARPFKINVQLYADGESVGEKIELTENVNWSHQWNNLPKYKADDQNIEIDYTVGEVDTEDMTNNGYEPVTNVKTDDGTYVFTSYNVNEEDGTYVFTIANQRDVDTFDLNGTKIWDDANNQDNVRPVKVTITLEAQNAEGDWTTATYANGDPVPAVEVTAENVDSANENQWNWKFEDLPVNIAGGRVQKITYRVTESVEYADGVTADYVQKTVAPDEFMGDKDGVVDVSITNSYEPKTINITVNKSWSDNNDAAMVRPDSIQLQLQQKIGDGEFTDNGDPVTLTVDSNGQWQKEFENLPVYAAKGQLITYRVVEVVETVTAEDTRYDYDYIVSGDVPVTGANGDPTINLTNTLELVDVSVKKVWGDADDKFGGRPEKVIVKLLRGNDLFDSVELKQDNNWQHEFRNLPKCDAESNEYTYTVTEEVTYSKYSYTNGEAVEAVKAEGIEFAYEFNNTLDTTDLSGTKHWEDFDNKFGSRTEVTLKVLANGEQLKDANGEDVIIKIEVPENPSENDWDWEYKGLPAKTADGTPIIYTVAEDDVIGYAESVAKNDANGTFQITNTLETVTVTGTKVWADSNNQDGKRPTEVILTLVNAPAAVENTVVTLSVEEDATNPAGAVINANSWSYTWTNLPKVDANGDPIAYTVTEQVKYLDGYKYSESTIKPPMRATSP